MQGEDFVTPVAAEAPSHAEPDKRTKWIDVLTVLILGLATIGTAWASFQAQQWGDETTRQYSLAASSRTE